MDLHGLRGYCLSKPGTTEERPFGPDTLVFKVMGRMFALAGDELQPEYVNLKCDPDDAMFFRSRFEGIKPGYHMNKRLWNSVYLVSDVPETLIRELIDDSYELVVAGLTRKAKDELAALAAGHPKEG